MNIKYGDKIIDSCRTINCPIYSHIINLSNNSGLNGVIKCPQLFCDRMEKEIFICKSCNSPKTLYQGCFNNNNFQCYNCDDIEKINEKEVKEDKKINNSEEITGKSTNEDEKFNEIEKTLVELSKNKDFMKNYRNSKNKNEYEFFNPLNNSITPLVWTKEYFNKTDIQDLKNEIMSFFKTYLDRFKEEDCSGCKNEETFYQSLDCTNCIRNKFSKSFIKQDKFKSR